MLSNVGPGKIFCAEAMIYACHSVNRLPPNALDNKTPMDIWSGRSAIDYNSLTYLWFHYLLSCKGVKVRPKS